MEAAQGAQSVSATAADHRDRYYNYRYYCCCYCYYCRYYSVILLLLRCFNYTTVLNLRERAWQQTTTVVARKTLDGRSHLGVSKRTVYLVSSMSTAVPVSSPPSYLATVQQFSSINIFRAVRTLPTPAAPNYYFCRKFCNHSSSISSPLLGPSHAARCCEPVSHHGGASHELYTEIGRRRPPVTTQKNLVVGCMHSSNIIDRRGHQGVRSSRPIGLAGPIH